MNRAAFKIIFCLITQVWFCTFGYGIDCIVQSDSLEHRQSIFAEGFGAGGYYSLNYGRQLWQNNYGSLEGRMGFSSYHWRDFTQQINPDLIVPVGLHAFWGKYHQLETAIGHTFSSLVKGESPSFRRKRVLDHHGYFQLGYRININHCQFFAGLSYVLLWERYDRLRHWPGIKIGYNFTIK